MVPSSLFLQLSTKKTTWVVTELPAVSMALNVTACCPDSKFPEFIFIDLLSYFKSIPITIQGCFGYGLKEIVKQLYNHNLINNQWSDDTDGLEAMMEIIKKSPLAESNNIPLKRYTEIKKIIYYNYMDCRVIIDILEMLEKMI